MRTRFDALFFFVLLNNRGKNFVIKYEGSLKNGNSDCLVLEHVEHDRPEVIILSFIFLLVYCIFFSSTMIPFSLFYPQVLKKEIDVFQLQWYGYCMFRALAGLHMQVRMSDTLTGSINYATELSSMNEF